MDDMRMILAILTLTALGASAGFAADAKAGAAL